MIFVICGKKRTGKDTAAKILTETGEFSSFAFADHIKYILEDAAKRCGVKAFSGFKYEKSFWQGDREKPLLTSNNEVCLLFRCAVDIMIERGIIDENLISNTDILQVVVLNTELWSIRRLMQVFGTDIVRRRDDSVWVRLALSESFKHTPSETGPKLSKHILFTDCRQPHEYKYMQRLGAKFIFLEKETGEADNHSTEQGLIPCPDDYIIDNNGTLEQLKSNILNLIKSV